MTGRRQATGHISGGGAVYTGLVELGRRYFAEGVCRRKLGSPSPCIGLGASRLLNLSFSPPDRRDGRWNGTEREGTERGSSWANTEKAERRRNQDNSGTMVYGATIRRMGSRATLTSLQIFYYLFFLLLLPRRSCCFSFVVNVFLLFVSESE